MIDAAAASRIAIGEALTNIAAADVELQRVKISANWMAACGTEGEDAKLFDAVRAASELCQTLGISVPVGKDSLSMKTAWRDGDIDKTVVAPISLVRERRRAGRRRAAVTDTAASAGHDTVLVLIDLGAGRNRMGGSIWRKSRSRSATRPRLDNPPS